MSKETVQTNSTHQPPQGWYYFQGDPAETVRFWNGSGWIGQWRETHPDAVVVTQAGALAHRSDRKSKTAIDGLILSVFL